MGSVGEYWREYRDYAERRRGADTLGMSLKDYDKYMRQALRKAEAERRDAKLARHTVQCECGRSFLDVNAHNAHKGRKGRKGHKGTPIHRPAEPKITIDELVPF